MSADDGLRSDERERTHAEDADPTEGSVPAGVEIARPLAPRHGRPAPHTLSASVLLHLAPGAAAAAGYLALLPLVRAWGLPSVAALSLSAVVAIAPVQLGILAVHARRAGPSPGLLVRRRTPLSPGAVAGWCAVVVAAAIAAFVVTAPLTSWVESRMFDWWPSHWRVELGTAAEYSRESLVWTALLMLVGSVLVAPVVEELYFRGFLLARMPAALGGAGPLVHALLFACYHLWTPWLVATRVLAIIPLVVVVRRTRSLVVAVLAHAVLNAVDVGLVLAAVAG